MQRIKQHQTKLKHCFETLLHRVLDDKIRAFAVLKSQLKYGKNTLKHYSLFRIRYSSGAKRRNLLKYNL